MTNPIYIQNKYHTWYHNIILNAQSQDRIKGNNQYYESHHIIPKSFGGTNQKTNLVLLTAREHYNCHYMLTKFTTGSDKKSMVYAFNMMHSENDKQKRYLNSRLYESNKNLISENMMGNTYNLGKKFSKEHKEKIGKSRKGKKHTNETKLKQSIVKLGKKHTKKSIEKMSGKNNHNYGRKLSNKVKLKMSITKLGKNNPNYKGDFHTVWGSFTTSKETIKKCPYKISESTIQKWCKNPDKIISNRSIIQSPYLKSLKESPLGKSFREIGFWIEPV